MTRTSGMGPLRPLLVVLVTPAAFLPTLQNQFVNWDDYVNFLDNPHYRGLAWTHLRWMWTTFHSGHYIPLTWMTLGLDCLLWGMSPVGCHMTILLRHAGPGDGFDVRESGRGDRTFQSGPAHQA